MSKNKKNSIDNIITPLTKRHPLNSDLSSRKEQMKKAINQGQKPEKNLWGNKLTSKEEKEWNW